MYILPVYRCLSAKMLTIRCIELPTYTIQKCCKVSKSLVLSTWSIGKGIFTEPIFPPLVQLYLKILEDQIILSLLIPMLVRSYYQELISVHDRQKVFFSTVYPWQRFQMPVRGSAIH